MMSNFLPVMDLYSGGYWPEFDRNREYEFTRVGDDEIFKMKLSDMSPFFNVYGLMFRIID